MDISLENIHPKLDFILSSTYGQLIFQEQVTEIVMELAGYSAGKADVIRKTIGRKIKEELDTLIPELKKSFMKYSGLTAEQADKIATSIQACSSYIFNKAHSVEYGLIAYQTAYLKANYPYEYMTALFNANMGDLEKVTEYREECRLMGIKVLPPSVSVGNNKFQIEQEPSGKRAIRIGLSYIKGINDISVQYESGMKFDEFFETNGYNKRVKEALIKSGAMDCFLESRGKMLNTALNYPYEIITLKNKNKGLEEKISNKENEKNSSNRETKRYGSIVKQIDKYKNDIISNNQKIMDIMSIMKDTESYDVAKGEIETLGFTFKNRYEDYNTDGIDTYFPNKINSQFVLGVIHKFKKIKDKNGKDMAFVRVEFIDNQSAELVMFSNYFKRLEENVVYLFKIRNKTFLESAGVPKRRMR